MLRLDDDIYSDDSDTEGALGKIKDVSVRKEEENDVQTIINKA